MRVIAVDDEVLALESLVSLIEKALPQAEVHSFRKSVEARAFAEDTPCDLAFLDVNMPQMDGVALAQALQKKNPRINLIFVTGYTEYAASAFALHASGFLHKPVTEEGILQELKALRFPLPESDRPESPRLRVRTFGNFQVCCGDEPLHFMYSKTLEMLAYLVDRNGAMCTIHEVESVLWPEDLTDHSSYMKNLRSDLAQALREVGCEEAFLRQRGRIGIAPKEMDCDYYTFLKNVKANRWMYQGEYMAQYSWAEYTNASLRQMVESLQ